MRRTVAVAIVLLIIATPLVQPAVPARFARAQDVPIEMTATQPPPSPLPDADGDGVADAVDNCPAVANPDQGDVDGNGVGDACEAPPPEPDVDADGVPDASDNCAGIANPDQEDAEGNGIGDACDLPATAPPPTVEPAATTTLEPAGTPEPLVTATATAPPAASTPSPAETSSPVASATTSPSPTPSPTLGPDDPSLYGWPERVGGTALFGPGTFDGVFPATVVARINAGGKKITRKDGTEWAADTGYEDGEPYAINSAADVVGTDADGLFRTERRATAADGSLSYRIPLPAAGRYRVTLGFVVPPAPDPFNPGEPVLRREKAVLEGGAAATDTFVLHARRSVSRAVFRSVTVEVTDGTLDVKLTATGGPASIATIEIERLTTPGEAIAAFALRYLGYPYVWATSGPDSFDCSGFTNWVVSQVLGVKIGLNQLEQIVYGVEVPKAHLRPGDLVFFFNTHPWIPGVSHVGIYVGHGQVVHASSASEGVIVSDITSGYYADHYYDAVRLAD